MNVYSVVLFRIIQNKKTLPAISTNNAFNYIRNNPIILNIFISTDHLLHFYS